MNLKKYNMTAVEYLEKKLDDALCDTDYITWQLVCKAVREAKEMEKQKQGYSEEEVLDIFSDWFDYRRDEDMVGRLSFNQWFNQFKKK